MHCYSLLTPSVRLLSTQSPRRSFILHSPHVDNYSYISREKGRSKQDQSENYQVRHFFQLRSLYYRSMWWLLISSHCHVMKRLFGQVRLPGVGAPSRGSSTPTITESLGSSAALSTAHTFLPPHGAHLTPCIQVIRVLLTFPQQSSWSASRSTIRTEYLQVSDETGKKTTPLGTAPQESLKTRCRAANTSALQ